VTGKGRRRPILVASAALLAMVLITGGLLAWGRTTDDGAAAGPPAAPLSGTVWQLLAEHGGDSSASLHIDSAGHLVADDSCQVVGADVHISGDKLLLTHQVVRWKSCTDSVGETTFGPREQKILRGTARYTIAGRTLTIRNGKTMRLRIAKLPAPSLDVATFVGADWLLVRASNHSGPHPVPAGVILRIDDHHHLRATDGGCRDLTGTVDAQLTSIRLFANVTGRLCPSSPTVGIVDSVLDGRIRHRVVDGYLTIADPGAGTLVYRWNPRSAATDPGRLTTRTWRLTGIEQDPAVGPATLSDGCRTFTGTAELHHGTADLRLRFGAAVPCASAPADQASTIDSFLGARHLVWAIRGGTLLGYGGGAQAFALRYRL
jgi:hypothetical protein